MTGENEHWYLIHCQPRKETYAANSLNHLLKLQIFLPENQVRSRGGTKSLPFFPGYIFAHMDLQTIPRSQVNACPGVHRLVEFGGEPQTVPQYVIDTIFQQLSAADQRSVPPGYPFSPGDIVQIKHGPLQHLEMIFTGSTTPGGRVQVLLELLGRLKEVQVDINMLEKSSAIFLVSRELNAQRERYAPQDRGVQRSA